MSRLVEKIFIRSFLIGALFLLQSCSNTLVGEKLENSFDTPEDPEISGKTNNKSQKINEFLPGSQIKKGTSLIDV